MSETFDPGPQSTVRTPPGLPSFRSRIMPVVVISNRSHAVPLAAALLEGGIDVIEITLRSDEALAAIEAVARSLPAMHVGAGTVTHATEVAQVMRAGASFALSPGFTPVLLDVVTAAGLPFVPGVATASEVMMAREAGFRLLKCFPATQLGGIDTLKAWHGPLADVRFCPTGGVTAAELARYLALPNVAMVGGSWLTPAAALLAGDWAQVRRLAREASTIAASVSYAGCPLGPGPGSDPGSAPARQRPRSDGNPPADG
jgi:2-dehydro-3-deoxyphosphogluconate aldolase/(4S)-4-hydroxy-2-oxoglutarate aldolase